MEHKVTRAYSATTETWRARAKAENLRPVYIMEVSGPSAIAAIPDALPQEPGHKERFDALLKASVKSKRSK